MVRSMGGSRGASKSGAKSMHVGEQSSSALRRPQSGPALRDDVERLPGRSPQPEPLRTDKRGYMSTQRKRTSPAITRVLTLFEAISNLHTGDLLTVLDLDGCAPFIFEMDANCRRLKRKHSGQTGWDVASIIEEQLCWVLGFGEAFLPTVQKEATGQPLGGRTFKGGASLHRRGRLRQRRERISKE
jgi:hypothetical protein